MKAAFFNKTGEAEVIQYGELPVPEIKEKQVLVKMKAVAANPVDTYIRAGKFPLEKPLPIPYIIGMDLVGTVSKVSNGSKFKTGQRVWTSSLGFGGRQGSFSEYAVVDEDRLYAAPQNVSDEEIVAVLQSAITACHGLLHVAKLRKGETIYINGAAGNVGSAVIQLAKACEATVIASSSNHEKIKWCQELGADLVVDYRHPKAIDTIKQFAPQGINVYWDTSRNPNFDVAVDLLAMKGRIVLMAGAEARPPFPVGPFYRKQCSMLGFAILNNPPEELQQCATIINMCLERKQLKAKIAAKLPLSEAAKAHQMLENDHDLWGKIVLS